MRTLDVDAAWKRYVADASVPLLRRVELHDVEGVGTISITPSRPLLAVVGGNGTGKSSLVGLLAEALVGSERARMVFPRIDMHGSGSLVVEVSSHLGDARVDLALDTRERTVTGTLPPVSLVVPGLQASSQQDGVLRDATFHQDVLLPLSPAQASPRTLKEMSYVVGRDYTKIDVFDLEDEDLPWIQKYVRVGFGDAEYGSEQMGLGELGLFLCLTALENTEPRSLVLIDEPEAGVSPLSQRRLSAILGVIGERRHLGLVLSTHSAHVLERIPRGNHVAVHRTPSGVVASVGPSAVRLAHALGLDATINRVALVEDRFAATMLRCCLDVVERGDLVEGLAIVPMSGAGNVVEACRRIPCDPAFPRTIGVLDGDQTLPADTLVWPVLALPGRVAPEKVVLMALARLLAEGLVPDGVDIASAERASAEAAGMDCHEGLRVLVERLGRGEEELTRWALRTSERYPDVQDELGAFAERFAASFEVV